MINNRVQLRSKIQNPLKLNLFTSNDQGTPLYVRWSEMRNLFCVLCYIDCKLKSNLQE